MCIGYESVVNSFCFRFVPCKLTEFLGVFFDPLDALYMLVQFIFCLAAKASADFRNFCNSPGKLQAFTLNDQNLSVWLPSQDINITKSGRGA